MQEYISVLFMTICLLESVLSLFLWKVIGMRFFILYVFMNLLCNFLLVCMPSNSVVNHYLFATMYVVMLFIQNLYFDDVLRSSLSRKFFAMLVLMAFALYVYKGMWRASVLISASQVAFFYFLYTSSSLWFVWKLITKVEMVKKSEHLLLGACFVCFYTMFTITESSTFLVNNYIKVDVLNAIINYIFEIVKLFIVIRILLRNKRD